MIIYVKNQNTSSVVLNNGTTYALHTEDTVKHGGHYLGYLDIFNSREPVYFAPDLATEVFVDTNPQPHNMNVGYTNIELIDAFENEGNLVVEFVKKGERPFYSGPTSNVFNKTFIFNPRNKKGKNNDKLIEIAIDSLVKLECQDVINNLSLMKSKIPMLNQKGLVANVVQKEDKIYTNIYIQLPKFSLPVGDVINGTLKNVTKIDDTHRKVECEIKTPEGKVIKLSKTFETKEGEYGSYNKGDKFGEYFTKGNSRITLTGAEFKNKDGQTISYIDWSLPKKKYWSNK